MRLAITDPRPPPPIQHAAICANTSGLGAISPKVAAIPPLTPIYRNYKKCINKEDTIMQSKQHKAVERICFNK